MGGQQPPIRQLDGVLRDVAAEGVEFRRPAPGKWSIAEIRTALDGRGAGDGVAIAKHAWRIRAWP